MKKINFGILILCFFILLMAHHVQAAKYDIKTMTSSVQSAIEGRQERYAQLQGLKSQGQIGENNQGYVTNRSGGNALSGIVNAENSDRAVIYKAIVEQNNLGVDGMGIVQDVFAEEQRGRAPSGTPIQMPSGEWATK